MKNERGWTKINRIHRALKYRQTNSSQQGWSEKVFLLKMSILEIDNNFYKGKGMIPLINPGEHHRELFSVTIHNHYIGTLRKLPRLIASGRLEAILMDLPIYGAIAPAKNTPLVPGSQADISLPNSPLHPANPADFRLKQHILGENPENTTSGRGEDPIPKRLGMKRISLDQEG